MPGYHDGHRERLKRRFEKNGLDGFAPHEVLELMLFYAIPRRDTNHIAHALIEHFGSFPAVLEADVDELRTVKGVGDSTAVMLSLFIASYRYYLEQTRDTGFVATSIKDTLEYAKTLFVGKKDECSYLMCFDATSKLITTALISQGSVTATEISIRKITEIATRCRAISVIIAHNHPGGIAMPSTGDLLATKKIFMVLHEIGIKLEDHLIVCGNEAVSLASSGVIYNIKTELRV